MNDTGSIGGVESVSVLVPCLNDADTIAGFLCELRRTLDILQQPSEIIVIDRGSTDDTVALAQKHGAQVLVCKEYSYGRALKAGIQACVGDYVITMHPDLSHNPAVVRELVLRRREADVLVASRYIHSGYAWMPMVRLLLSRTLNRLLSFVLGMPFRDMTSSFRLYRRAALNAMEMQGDGYALLLEILVRLYSSGCRVLEIPFHYWAPSTGYKWPVAVRLACDYLRTLLAMWRLRNSIESADYDERAFDSRIPLQRYWQRKRYRTVVSMVNHASTILDVGCGSSKILDALPQSVALDLRTEKLRYKKTAARKSICASVLALPFRDQCFEAVIFSQVIEHLPRDPRILDECVRVLLPGGILVVGTPDYGRRLWPIIEWFYSRLHPRGYADEHISHYTLAEIRRELALRNLHIEQYSYVLGAELIVKARLRQH